MLHPTQTNKMFEIPGDKLRAIIRDNPGSGLRECFSSPLQNRFHISLSHRGPDFPMDNVTAVSI
jgi:hypothetical protein